MAWETNWSHPKSNGSQVMARNPEGKTRRSREWHLRGTGTLRRAGVSTPTYRKDSWEINWKKRRGKFVLARNLESKMPRARVWHWIGHKTLDNAGVKWKPAFKTNGRYEDGNGYILLSRRAMTNKDIALAEKHGLFRGRRKTFVREHHIVAVKKYGALPKGFVVRHRNGIKSDNAPKNLLVGTSAENTRDHNSARLQAIYWRRKYERLKASTQQQRTTTKGE